MPTRETFSAPVYHVVLSLVAMLHPVGSAHLIAATAALTAGVSRAAATRAVERLLNAGVLRRHHLPPGLWCRSMRSVVTTGVLWGCDTRFRTLDVPRGPQPAQYPDSVLAGHLIGAHRLLAALLAGERILADDAWVVAARDAAPQLVAMDRLSVYQGLVTTGQLPTAPHTLLGIVRPHDSSLIFGGHWTGELGDERLERLTRACRPITLEHPNTPEVRWLQRARRAFMSPTDREDASALLSLIPATKGGLDRFHAVSLAACRVPPDTVPPISKQSAIVLLEWRRRDARRPGIFSHTGTPTSSHATRARLHADALGD